MEEHEQEGKEIEADLERNAALAVTAGSNLWMGVKQREHRRREAQQRDYEAVLAAEWELLSMRREDGGDPSLLGTKDADQQWARTSDPNRVVAAYAIADHYAEKSQRMEGLRDNLAGTLTEYGLDPKEMLSLSPQQAAEQFRAARGASFESDPEQLEREAQNVTRVTEQAQDLDSESTDLAREADRALSDAEDAERDHAGVEANGTAEPRRNRALEVGSAGSGPAVVAAQYAATDHPTNPGQASAKAPDNARKPNRQAEKGRKRDRGGRS